MKKLVQLALATLLLGCLSGCPRPNDISDDVSTLAIGLHQA